MQQLEFQDRISLVASTSDTSITKAGYFIYNTAEWWCETGGGRKYKIIEEKVYHVEDEPASRDLPVLRMIVMAAFYPITILAFFTRGVGRFYLARKENFQSITIDEPPKDFSNIIAVSGLSLAFLSGIAAKWLVDIR